MPPSQAEILAAYQQVSGEVRSRLVQYADLLWGGMGSWRDADVDRFVEEIVPKIQAGRLQMAQLTDAYLSQITGATAGIIDTSNLRGVDASDLYRRPATELYTNLSQGKSFDDSMKAAAARLGSLVATDMQLAKTHQSQRSMNAGGIQMFRRVLSGDNDCALCIVASTQHYWKKKLLPIHPGCQCSVEPLTPGWHPQVLDPDQLETIHAQVESLTGASDRGARLPDYRQLIQVREHGEIGPTLTWRNQNFTGPHDVSP